MLFICDLTNKEAKEYLKKIEESNKSTGEKLKFLEAQMEAIKEECDEIWVQFFKEMKKQGLIPKNTKYDDVDLIYNKKTKQFFMSETDRERGGFVDFLDSMR